MHYHLFFSLVKHDGPYRIKEKAVHVGAYASKEEAYARWQELGGKFSQNWQPDIVPPGKNPLQLLPYPQKQPVAFTAANDPALKTEFPNIDWKFEHPVSKNMDFEGWTSIFLREWQREYQPPAAPVETPRMGNLALVPQIG